MTNRFHFLSCVISSEWNTNYPLPPLKSFIETHQKLNKINSLRNVTLQRKQRRVGMDKRTTPTKTRKELRALVFQ